MVAQFQIGDRVRPKTGPPAADAGVIVQCQPACVYRVRLGDGTIRYYSGQQLEPIGAGSQRKRGDRIPFTEEGREGCN